MPSYWSLYLARKQQQLCGPVNYRDFRETGPWVSPLFLDQTEARREVKSFWDRPPPLHTPPYLRVWMTAPHPLPKGLDPPLYSVHHKSLKGCILKSLLLLYCLLLLGHAHWKTPLGSLSQAEADAFEPIRGDIEYVSHVKKAKPNIPPPFVVLPYGGEDLIQRLSWILELSSFFVDCDNPKVQW